MYLFKRKKLFFKTLCLVLLSSLTLNLYSFDFSNFFKKSEVPTQEVLTQEQLLNKRKVIEKNILGQVVFGKDSIITDNEWKELEVDKIVEKWEKYTKSNFDSWGIKYLLKNAPEGSKEILKTLTENEQAYKIVDEIVEKMKAAEEPLATYYNKKIIPKNNKFIIAAEYLIGGAFFGLSSGLDAIASSNKFSTRTNAKIHSISSIFKTIIAPVYSIFSLLGGTQSMIDLFKALKNGDKSFSLKNSFIYNFKKIIRDFNPIPAIFKPGCIDTKKEKQMRYFDSEIDSDYKKTTLGDQLVSNNIHFNLLMKNATQNKKKHTIKIGNNKAINCLSWSISIGASLTGKFLEYLVPILSIKKAFTEINNHRQKCKEMQKNLSKIADMIKSLEQLKSDANLKNNFFIKSINNLLDQARQSTHLKELFSLLDSPSFTKDASNYSVGEVIAANNLLKEITAPKWAEDFSILSTILKNAACLGGYRAIAAIIKESQNSNSNAKFCFVEKIDSPTPVIDLKKAWFPFLDPTKAVPNDINLGNNSPRNAIITGPNSGGKTNSMRTVGFNVLLSRLGIACAETAKITDFSRIVTYLAPKEETDLSHFQSEAKGIENVKSEIKKYHNNKKNILAILDEPYRGTTGPAGQRLVYELGMEIAKNYDNCAITMMATHHLKPCTLPEKTDGQFKNYQMDYLENENGTFKKTYKLKDGLAEWWFKDEDKSYKFITDLMAFKV